MGGGTVSRAPVIHSVQGGLPKGDVSSGGIYPGGGGCCPGGVCQGVGGGVLPRGCLPRGGGGGGCWWCPPRVGCLPRARPPPPPEMATAAVGMHPTGMQSCVFKNYTVSLSERCSGCPPPPPPHAHSLPEMKTVREVGPWVSTGSVTAT